jgi:hypothetical protein
MSRRLAPHVVVALAFVLLVGQASGFTHFALVRHATCPEHGELIHQPEGAPLRDAPSDAPSLRDATDDSPDGHEHCLFSCIRRERATLAELEPAIRQLAPTADATVRERRAPRPASVALFLLAPKNSPPA